MGRYTVMGFALAVIAAGLVGPPALASVPTTVDTQSAPITASERAGQRKAVGTLKVKVRGTGSYTVKGKGFRKTRRVSKAFKVKPGTYRVKARRGSATPAKVRIRKGKTVRVTVKFKKKRNKTVVPTPATSSPPASSAPPSSPPPPDTTPPGPVSGLTVGQRTDTSIGLSWTLPADADLDEVVVRRAKGTTPPATATAGTGITLGGKKATSVTDTGLEADTGYSYALFTRDTSGNTGTAVTVTTSTRPAPDTTPPGPVSGLTVGQRTDTSIGLSWTLPADADLDEVVVRRAKGTTPPATASAGTAVTLGSKKATSVTDTGLDPDTEYSYALFTRDTSGNTSAAVTVTAATRAPEPPQGTVGDWAQPDADSAGSRSNLSENVIIPASADQIREEYSLGDIRNPVMVDGRIYGAGTVPDRPGTYAPFVIDAASGDLLSHGPSLPGGCGEAPVAVTEQLIILAACGPLQAFDRAAPHALRWSTQDTDPGASGTQLVVAGDMGVLFGGSSAMFYRLSDGARLWQFLPPTGETLVDVAVSGDTVVLATDKEVHAFSLDGQSLWSVPHAGGSVQVGGGAVFVRKGGGLAKLSLATGDEQWSALAGQDVYELVAVDTDTVYAWRAVFNFGPPAPSDLLAVDTADGSTRWTASIPSRIRSVAVTGSMVWLSSTEIFSQGRSSDLIGLERTTGAQEKTIHFDDNTYGNMIVSGGRVLFPQGGSAGMAPGRLRVFSLNDPRPTITSKVLPSARAGTAYSAKMAASDGTPGYTWSLTAGALPTGLSLDADGTISGTATSEGTAKFTVKVTDSKGRQQSRLMLLAVLGTGATEWTQEGHDPGRTRFNPTETSIRLGTANQVAFRWKTPTLTSGSWPPGFLEPAVGPDGTVYAVDHQGRLAAWAPGGSGTTRDPLWTVNPPTPNLPFASSPALSDGVLYLQERSGLVVAIRVSDHQVLWTRQMEQTGYGDGHLLVVAGKVLVIEGYSSHAVQAIKTSDGSDAWNGAQVDLKSAYQQDAFTIATDGTRGFAVHDCEVVAFNIADAQPLWTQQLDPNCYPKPAASAVVADGVVYASASTGTVAMDALTGDVRWSTGTGTDGQLTLASGILVGTAPSDNGAFALSSRTGEALWQNREIPVDSVFSAAEDLLIGRGGFTLKGYSLLTGQQVLDLGTPDDQAWYTATAIADGKLYVPTTQGIRVYARP